MSKRVIAFDVRQMVTLRKGTTAVGREYTRNS